MAVAEHIDLSFIEKDNTATCMMPNDKWRINDSGLDGYCTVQDLPAETGGLRNIIEQNVGKSALNTALDLAGGENGLAIQELLREGYIGNALLTTFIDRRSDETKMNPAIKHVAGNLMRTSTWREIIDWKEEISPEGIALVLHRPLGALQNLKPETYAGLTNLVLDLIKPKGVFFTQIPLSLYATGFRKPDLTEICEFIDSRSDIDSVFVGDDILFTSAVIIKK